MEIQKTLRLAIPLIIGELSQVVLHIIDMAMVGGLGYKHLAAASLVFNVLNIPLVLGIGIAMAVAQTVSMANGRRDGWLVSHYFFNGIVLCLITATIIAVGMELSNGILFHLGQDETVAALAVPFMRVMCVSIIPMLLFIALQQFTDGLERTRTAMLISVAALPLNVIINWLLIYGNLGFPRLGLQGAAWGTLITRVVVCAAMVLVILFAPFYRRYMAVWRSQWKVSGKTMRELLYIGIPTSLQVTMESGAFAVSAILVGTMGAVSLAAHQIAMSCMSFTFIFSMGLAGAGSIRTSNAYGAADWRRVFIIGKGTLQIALVFGLICVAVFLLSRNILPLAFNNTAQVISLSSTLILFAAIMQVPDAIQANAAGLLRGIKDVYVPTGSIAVAYWVMGLPCGYYLSFHLHMGPIGIWLGFIIGLSVSSLLLTLRFFRMERRQQLQL
ncbi:MATE family efflux transporter [Chitinophaga nivalis]|uniref:Multidrug-efflux transporter n=1 Tax=Chitinophaga nivalis TaxID=2991709 RepID=A0ABT3IMM1_9BACT|nr:MATE family efflux transporter [Chitinophaga nivalis]MCW3465087.1 MATE family efflux transporter [Chitinophaga nivalis]MCW3485221.1 MATE family efflux transporter [Chitinophaga nivalis]